MQTLRQILYYLALGLMSLAGLLVLGLQLYKEEIKAQALSALNPYLATELRIGQVRLELFERFPQLALELKALSIASSIPGDTAHFAKAGRLQAFFSVPELIQGRYRVQGLLIEDADLHFLIDQNEQPSYVFWQLPESDSSEEEGAASFQIEGAILRNVTLRVQNKLQQLSLSTQVKEATLSALFSGDSSLFQADMQLHLAHFMSQGQSLASNLDMGLQTGFMYHDGRYALQEGKVSLKNLEFGINGFYQYGEETSALDLQIAEAQTSLKEVIAAFPGLLAHPLGDYDISGQARFSARCWGSISRYQLPALSLNAALSSASLLYKPSGWQLQDINLAGELQASDLAKSERYDITLSAFRAQLFGHPLQGKLRLKNLNEPWLDTELKGKLSLAGLSETFDLSPIDSLAGTVDMDLRFKGLLADLEQTETLDKADFAGDLRLQEVYLAADSFGLAYEQLNGLLSFEKPFLMVEDLEMQLGKSRLQVEGYFKNLFAHLFNPEEPLVLVADVRSPYLDVSDFMRGKSESAEADEGTLYLPAKLRLQINAQLDSIRYARFKAAHLKGGLRYAHGTAKLERFAMEGMGGQLQLDGQLLRDAAGYRLQGKAKMDSLDIREVMYQMDDFGQDYLKAEQVKGRVSATLDFSFGCDSQWQVRPQSMLARAEYKLSNGELIDFFPVMKVMGVAKIEDLQHLYVDRLENVLIIQNDTIIIPQLDIISRKLDIGIQGFHTFNDHIDYRIRVNLSSLLAADKPDLPQQYQWEEEEAGKTQLFLRITGTVDEPKIRPDVKNTIKQLGKNLKRHTKRFVDLFKHREKSTRELEREQEQARLRAEARRKRKEAFRQELGPKEQAP